jgi:hypothetical protein
MLWMLLALFSHGDRVCGDILALCKAWEINRRSMLEVKRRTLNGQLLPREQIVTRRTMSSDLIFLELFLFSPKPSRQLLLTFETNPRNCMQVMVWDIKLWAWRILWLQRTSQKGRLETRRVVWYYIKRLEKDSVKIVVSVEEISSLWFNHIGYSGKERMMVPVESY